MSNENEILAETINKMTEKLSVTLLKEYKKLPTEFQKGFVLMKCTELLLANVICQMAHTNAELDELVKTLTDDMKELVSNCAMTGFSKKFGISHH